MNETPKQMKETLKRAGYDVRRISIRHRYTGYSEAYDVTVKAPEYDTHAIRDLLRPFREVGFDERTGETLMGGNTYVFVQRD